MAKLHQMVLEQGGILQSPLMLSGVIATRY